MSDDSLLWLLFILGWFLVPVVVWSEKRQRRRLRQWSREDKELMDRWEKEMGIKK